ncbi:putative reverse transcriptase domain-containing protein [Tanacetum coccineum]
MESTTSSLHNIYSFYEPEALETGSEEMVEVDINTLTMEQYMALTIGNNGNNVNFEIKGQFIKELRYNTFADTKGEDAYGHVQRVHIFYKSLDIVTRHMLDSQGSISKMSLAQALESIQDMGDHSQKWHDRASTRQRCSDSSGDIVAITNKLDNLRCDVKKLKENVHVVQVGCEIYEGIHKTKECPLNDEEIRVEEEQREEEQESTVRLNARCSAVLQNQLPAKEKDLGSFILPCLIGSLNASDALDDLGASIRVMPFFMFKRLGLVNLKPVNMLIEMEDKSMQASKGIVEDVLVKIDKFIFLVDFVILDKVEDDKVTIILGQSMLATALA